MLATVLVIISFRVTVWIIWFEVFSFLLSYVQSYIIIYTTILYNSWQIYVHTPCIFVFCSLVDFQRSR